jgi:hypothetical protein
MRLTRSALNNAVFIISFLLILSSCTTLSPVGGQADRIVSAESPERVMPQWQPFAEDKLDGLAYFTGKVSSPRFEFHALRVDLSVPELRILAAGGGDAISGDSGGEFLSTKVSSFVRSNDLIAGINALPFDPVSGKEGEPRVNIGIVVADGVMISAPHPRYDALVFYTDGQAMIIAQSEIDTAENIASAVGGFRRILENNELVPRVLDLDARHPRSAAGISQSGRYLYLLVIDGRRLGSIGSTEAETALLLRALGASEGINFDGGGSTALALRYPDGKVRVVNTPIHDLIPGRERAVAGCLGIWAE